MHSNDFYVVFTSQVKVCVRFKWVNGCCNLIRVHVWWSKRNLNSWRTVNGWEVQAFTKLTSSTAGTLLIIVDVKTIYWNQNSAKGFKINIRYKE